MRLGVHLVKFDFDGGPEVDRPDRGGVRRGRRGGRASTTSR